MDRLIAKRRKEILDIQPKKVWVPIGYEKQAIDILKANGITDAQVMSTNILTLDI